MTTLAQALQNQPDPGPGPWIVEVISATTGTIETAAGPIVNGLWGRPPNNSRVVVFRVEGIDIALGLIGST